MRSGTIYSYGYADVSGLRNYIWSSRTTPATVFQYARYLTFGTPEITPSSSALGRDYGFSLRCLVVKV